MRLRVPLATATLPDGVVEALWGAIEAGMYRSFGGRLRAVYLARTLDKEELVEAACRRLAKATPCEISGGDAGGGGPALEEARAR